MAASAPGMLKLDTTQYDVARKRATQQNQADVQSQRDAIARRAAMAGGGPSGAFAKQEQQAMEAGARRLQDVNEGIDAQVAQERQRINEVNTGRDFARAEREAGQAFARGEREAGQLFATGEREAGQAFTTQERLGSQEFVAGESALARELQKEGLAIQEAGLTGTYKGAQTLAGKAYDEGVKQQALENSINIPTTILAALGNLKTLGYTPDQINALLTQLGIDKLPGMGGIVAGGDGSTTLSGIPGVTQSAPPPSGPTALEAASKTKAPDIAGSIFSPKKTISNPAFNPKNWRYP